MAYPFHLFLSFIFHIFKNYFSAFIISLSLICLKIVVQSHQMLKSNKKKLISGFVSEIISKFITFLCAFSRTLVYIKRETSILKKKIKPF